MPLCHYYYAIVFVFQYIRCCHYSSATLTPYAMIKELLFTTPTPLLCARGAPGGMAAPARAATPYAASIDAVIVALRVSATRKMMARARVAASAARPRCHGAAMLRAPQAPPPAADARARHGVADAVTVVPLRAPYAAVIFTRAHTDRRA